VIVEMEGRRLDSLRGLVLDYGFAMGAEAELEALLRRGARPWPSVDSTHSRSSRLSGRPAMKC
jgi:hypothetical protein